MRRDTYLEEKNLSDEEKSLIRSLYYEDRILLSDVADLLSPMAAMRAYQLKDSIQESADTIPDPDIGSIPSDEDFYEETIPSEVLEEFEEYSSDDE